jgi:transcription elongation factor GreA
VARARAFADANLEDRASALYLQRLADAGLRVENKVIRGREGGKAGWTMIEKVPMTVAGHAALEEELKKRMSEDRPRIIDLISQARAHGDLSENAEYHAAKEAQSHNEGRIAELEDQLSRAEVIDVSKLSGESVIFGATVKLVDEDTDEERVYQIVGDAESDVKEGRISISSPIARALIGKSVGDTVEVTAPGGSHSYEILEVLFS